PYISTSFFFQAADGIRDFHVTGVQTCALPIFSDEQGVAPAAAGERVAPRLGVRHADEHVLQGPLLLVGDAGRGDHAPPVLHDHEIGRASCRERVWISVADVSWNKCWTGALQEK